MLPNPKPATLLCPETTEPVTQTIQSILAQPPQERVKLIANVNHALCPCMTRNPLIPYGLSLGGGPAGPWQFGAHTLNHM